MQQRTRTATEIAWNPPPLDWIALNTDGSVKPPESLAAAGGLLRDSFGRCLGSFASNLGACTITRAELMGAIQGLKLAWLLGHRKVQLRTDSTTAISIMNSHTTYGGRYHNLWTQLQDLIHQECEIEISHTFREGNKSADYLANKGHSLSLGYHVIERDDPGLNFWLLYDSMGNAQSRLI
ncbi:unnamed protein product [Linum tenue]|uniref:RNase H type-1 domain-containing protein n=1 Tax=Linum tenue TaxID=586396 RepID=A0AAV0MA84_9ROSI|nr:unnamed protein product [Linum tenue]